jgi:hypothetical protein
MQTLEEVVEAFASWRANRRNKKESIPERLWDMARALLPHYKKSHIIKALGVCGNRFYQCCVLPDKQKTVATTEDGFAVGVLEAPSFHEEACALMLQGQHKSLSIKISIRNLPHVLSLVEGYL